MICYHNGSCRIDLLKKKKKKKKKRKENVIGCSAGMTAWIIMRVFRVSGQLAPGGIIYNTKLLGKAQSHLD